ncbi:hypothetical protein ACEPAF_5182 [Sanghuangporus sanghuang]
MQSSISSRQFCADDRVDFFLNAEGCAIKFRVQCDLSDSLKMRLEDGITLHGGIMINKIPIHGLVIVDPKSRTGRNLIHDWAWKVRPGRQFVPYSFILQCINEKRLLPIDEHALHLEQQHTLDASTQYDLPRNVKDKLALFLATILPHSSGKRSSNNTYKKLVKNKERYPWAGDYDWKILRNHYCRNKKYYDKLISVIAKKRAGKKILSSVAPSIVTSRKRFLIEKKADNNAKLSVIEVVLPSRNEATTKDRESKKVKFDKPFLIERKRKFGNDITNEKMVKKPRTIDDMLKAPLPPIVAERKITRRPAKQTTSPVLPAGNVSDIEIGRPASKDAHTGVWIDDGFKEDGLRGKKNTLGPSGPRLRDCFSESLVYYNMGLDDLRLAASLDLVDNSNDSEVIDEASVLELLELPTEANAARGTDPKLRPETREPSHSRAACLHLENDEASRSAAILELAASTRFTAEEIKQKLHGFSENMDKTRDFFLRCRQLVDDLFISSSITERAALEASREMSTRGDNCPVQVLRSPPEARPKELQVVDFGLDAATAPPATLAISRPIRCYSLPPSPPYTNPHLRRAIPLPLLDEIASSGNHQTGLMESEKNGERRVLSMGMHGPANLLSPPYSTRKRSLSLLTVDEKEEEEPTRPLSAAAQSNQPVPVRCRWGESDDDANDSEPPIMKLKDLDLGEESDDWDEPLFLNAPSVFKASDCLSLNLFGAVYSSDDEEPSSQSPVPPSSPTICSSSLPDFGYEGLGERNPQEKSKPLFDPSDFDVFENGWDTVTTDSTQSSLSSHESSRNSTSGPVRDESTEFCVHMEPSLFAAPSSPSRRGVIDLPADENSEPVLSESLTRSRAPIIEGDEFTRELDQLFGHSCPSRNTFHCSHNHRPVDVPSEVIQTPFNIPLLLPSYASRTPPANSLLFAALEPQEIPLPESPQSPVLNFQGEYVVPPIMLEESRIRRLHQEMVKVEADARTRETLLTEYIARLNSLKPPSPTVPVAVYCPEAQNETESCPSEANDDGSKPMQLEKQQSSAEASSSYFSNQASAALEFLQARRKEVQNAVAMRAAERRRRKYTKERIRELEALLQLKINQLCSTYVGDGWTLSVPTRGRKGRNDEAIVLAASGSDRHSHTNAIFLEGDALEPQSAALHRRKQDGIMQLVAKMVFRRRDTSRPLSGKSAPMVHEYVPSGLSRTAYVDETGDETGNDEANDDLS